MPFSAGGPTDKIARDLAEALRKPLGQTVIVDNTGRRRRHDRHGAGAARAGRTATRLLVHHIGLATAPALYKKLGYKTEDLEFLGLINEAPSTLIGKQALPAANFAELRKYIAANGGKINLANAGVGSASHLCSLMLQSALKSDMVFVPYKGTGPAMNDLLGGQVDLMCEQATNSTPQIEAKKVKAYGVTSAQRMQGAGARVTAHARGKRPAGLQLHGLARSVRAPRHAARGPREDQRRAAHRAQGPRVDQAAGGARHHGRHRWAARTRRSTGSSSRAKSVAGRRPSRTPASTRRLSCARQRADRARVFAFPFPARMTHRGRGRG